MDFQKIEKLLELRQVSYDSGIENRRMKAYPFECLCGFLGIFV